MDHFYHTYNLKSMSYKIEPEYVDEWNNKGGRCEHCASYSIGESEPYCAENKNTVTSGGHCNFFQSLD